MKALRTGRNPKLTQAEAAEAIGISRTHLSKIENDEYAGGREALAAIATYYGVTMDYLEFGPKSGGPVIADEAFHRDDQRAWLDFGADLGGGNRMTLIDFARKTILGQGGAGIAPERRRKK